MEQRNQSKADYRGKQTWGFAMRRRWEGSRNGVVSGFFFSRGVFLDGHVLELRGLEDFAALFTFDVFGVFFAGHDLNTGVFAHRFHA